MSPALTASTYDPVAAPFATDLENVAYAGLCLFLFSIPWEAVAHLSGFPLGVWVGSTTLVIALARTVSSFQRRKLAGTHLWMLGFVALSAISTSWTIDSEATISRISTYAQLLIVVWLIWELAPSEARVLGLMQAYVWGNVLMSLLTIRNYALGRTAAQLQSNIGMSRWEEGRYSVTGINENDMGLMLAMCLPMILYLALRAKGTVSKLTAWAQLVLCVTAILLSGSRGSLLSAAIALLMLPLTLGYFNRSQQIVAGVACLAIVVCAVVFIPSDIWYRLGQFSTEVTGGTLTNRTFIWAAGFASFRDHPWLGVGSGAYQASVLRLIDVPYVAHNTFLSILVELGIVGELVWIAIWATAFYCALRMRYVEKCLWLLILISWSTGVMALTWEYHKATWICLALLLAHAYSRRSARGVERPRTFLQAEALWGRH